MRRRDQELAQRLDSLLLGEREAQHWLEKHPEFRRELEELKALSLSIPALPADVRPSLEWRQRTKEELLARLRRRRRRRGV